MVSEAVELAEIELRRRNVQAAPLRGGAHAHLLMVDPILIEQVLVNLLKNAAESIDSAAATPPQRAALSCAWSPRQIEWQGAGGVLGHGLGSKVWHRR
jgi:nitrogen fixation/metabolism regulation signal transduction histidine kinase